MQERKFPPLLFHALITAASTAVVAAAAAAVAAVCAAAAAHEHDEDKNDDPPVTVHSRSPLFYFKAGRLPLLYITEYAGGPNLLPGI